jgi:hypothetical protein
MAVRSVVVLKQRDSEHQSKPDRATVRVRLFPQTWRAGTKRIDPSHASLSDKISSRTSSNASDVGCAGSERIGSQSEGSFGLACDNRAGAQDEEEHEFRCGESFPMSALKPQRSTATSARCSFPLTIRVQHRARGADLVCGSAAP